MGILRVLSDVNNCMWIVPRTPAVMVIRGLTFQMVALSVWMRGLYLLDFPLMASLWNMSWQYVMVLGKVGVMGGWLSVGSLSIHKIVR